MALRPLGTLALLVIPLVVAPLASSSGELLRNGGFEVDANLDGVPDGWQGQAVALRSPGARSGTHALLLGAAGYVTSDPVPVQPGTTLSLLGWARSPVALEADLQFTENVGGSHVVRQSVRASSVASPALYLPFVAESVVPTGVTHARVRLDLAQGPMAGPVAPLVLAPGHIDDVSLRVVPGDGSVLFNGGVEINQDGTPAVPDGWTANCPAPSSFQRSSVAPRSGAYSMDLVDQHAHDVCSLHSPRAPLAQGKLHVYSVDVKVESGWGVLAYESYGDGVLTEVVFGAAQPAGSGWVTLTLTQCAGAGDEEGRLRVFATNVQGSASVPSAKVRFDNARIVPGAAC